MAKRKRKPIAATKELKQHIHAATEALNAVLTGYRLSHDRWTEDVERANNCITMAFNKDDDVFELSKFLIRKYDKKDKETI